MSTADRPALVKRPPTHPAEPEPIAVTPPPAESPPATITAPTSPPVAGEVLLAVRVPADLRRWYKRAALDHDRSMKELIITALEEYQGKLASNLATKPAN